MDGYDIDLQSSARYKQSEQSGEEEYRLPVTLVTGADWDLCTAWRRYVTNMTQTQHSITFLVQLITL